MFRELAKQGENARVSITDCYSAIISGNTRGIKNVANVIETFNRLDPKNQKDFANAIKLSNSQLGTFLLSTKQSNKSLGTYGASLVATKAKTIGLTVATTALNAALTMGISVVINAAVSVISDMVRWQEKYAEATQEATDKIKAESNSVEDYTSKIIELRKALDDNNTSENRNKEIREELSRIQDDLIENYGLEKNGLNLINGTLDDQIQKLKERNQLSYYKDVYSLNPSDIENRRNKMNTQTVSVNRNRAHSANGAIRDLFEEFGFVSNGLSGELESWEFTGDIYTIDKKLQEIQDRIKEISEQKPFLKETYENAYQYLADVRRDWSNKLIEDNKDVFSEWIKNGEEYSDTYYNLIAARANYEYTVENGTAKEITKAKIAWAEKYQNALNKIPEEDPAVKSWFENEFGDVGKDIVDDKIVDNVSETAKKLSELNSTVESLKETTDSAFSNQSTLQSAFDKIQEGSSLSADEVRKLVSICENDFPEINTMFTKTADGWTISADNLIKANKALMDSTKKSVQSQIDGYQEVINQYEYAQKQIDRIQNATGGMPDSAKQAAINGLGISITADEYEKAKNKAEELKLVLAMLGFTLEDNTDKFDKLSKIMSSMSSKMKSVSSAFKEQEESGSLSADTIVSIIESGYAAALMYDEQTRAVTLNKNAYLQLVKAEIEKRRVDVKIERDTAVQERLNAVTEYANILSTTMYDAAKKTALLGKEQAKITQNDELIKMWDAELAALDKYESELDNVLAGKYGNSDKNGSSSDPIKEAFEKEMKDIEHLHNMGLASDKEYYDALEKANEEHYKNSAEHESDYLSNVEKIYKARQSLYKDDANKQFDNLDEQFKNGEITAERYAKALYDLGQSLYGKDSPYANTEFATKALEELDKKVKEVSDDIYSELKDNLSADGDRLLDDVLADADELSKKNIELFKNKGDLKTFKKNAEDIFKTVSASAKDALERGLITPERFKEIVDAYSEGLDNGIIQDIFDDGFDAIADKAKDNLDKMLITPDEYFKLLDEWGKKLNISEDVIKKLKEALSESDYLDAWDLKNGFDSKKSADNFELRAERIKYIFELAEQLYGKDGQDNVKAYNELIKQGLEDEQSLVEDYYDKEIEKLEKINDEEEKRQKAIELQMNLIKARQKLEDAKKQKNQLVFYNGTFEYMEDQESVKSAQEDVLEAEKSILEQQVEDQKEALEERKKAASEFFNKVEGDVSGALERIEKFISGDTSVYEKPVDKANSISNESNNKINTIGNLGTKGLFEKLIILFGGIPANNSMRDFMESFASSLIGKQIIPTTIRDAITNNSSTTNNTAKTEIHIDKIFENLNMPQGTTKEQVEEFFKHLNQAILQRIPQVILDVKK